MLNRTTIRNRSGINTKGTDNNPGSPAPTNRNSSFMARMQVAPPKEPSPVTMDSSVRSDNTLDDEPTNDSYVCRLSLSNRACARRGFCENVFGSSDPSGKADKLDGFDTSNIIARLTHVQILLCFVDKRNLCSSNQAARTGKARLRRPSVLSIHSFSVIFRAIRSFSDRHSVSCCASLASKHRTSLGDTCKN
jgi:hypothetical protein